MDNDTISETIFTRIKNLFKRKRKVKVGDLGVYHDVCGYIPIGSTRNKYYDVYIKVKAVEVYENLIEIEVIDVKISESDEMLILIKQHNIKYLQPSEVQWQVNETK